MPVFILVATAGRVNRLPGRCAQFVLRPERDPAAARAKQCLGWMILPPAAATIALAPSANRARKHARHHRPWPAGTPWTARMREPEFHRIRRLAPYVFAEVNRLKAAARAQGKDI